LARVADELLAIDSEGTISVIGTGFAQFSQMTFGPDGYLYLAEEHNNQILRLVPECLGDIFEDGTVDVLDLLLVLGTWGECDGECPTDLNDDGFVDVGDVLLLLAAWGECP
jgi:hypothetical protein